MFKGYLNYLYKYNQGFVNLLGPADLVKYVI